jgi:Acetyltransferase (GNAT) domain
MMISYRSRLLRRAEVWYDQEPEDTRSVDWILYMRRSQPVPGAQTSCFYSYVIDLSQSPEQLLANLTRDTAYKIRRARERDKITCECWDPRDPAALAEFAQVANAFAALKHLSPLNRPRMESMAAAGVLDLSVAKDPRGKALVFHANYRDRDRASGIALVSLYRAISDSAERNLIGRANRYLTWSEIERYREHGVKYFDFGGWYRGTDPGMLRVNDFKRGFGGAILREYKCEQILTPRGRWVFGAAKLLERARSLLARRRVPPAGPPPEAALPDIPLRTDPAR